MIINNPAQTYDAERVDITCYRRNSFVYEIDCTKLLTLLGNDFKFSLDTFVGFMEVKTKNDRAENYTSVLTFSSSDIELVDPEINSEDSEIYPELTETVTSPPKIILTKADITLAAGTYYYDIFIIKDGQTIVLQYGKFTVKQNITNWTEIPEPPVGEPDLEVIKIYASHDVNNATASDFNSGIPGFYSPNGTDEYNYGGLGTIETAFYYECSLIETTNIIPEWTLRYINTNGPYSFLINYAPTVYAFTPMVLVVVNRPGPMYCVLRCKALYNVNDWQSEQADTPSILYSDVDIPIPVNSETSIFYNEIITKIPKEYAVLERVNEVLTGNYVMGYDFTELMSWINGYCHVLRYDDGLGITEIEGTDVTLRNVNAVQFTIDTYMHPTADTPDDIEGLLEDSNIMHNTIVFDLCFNIIGQGN